MSMALGSLCKLNLVLGNLHDKSEYGLIILISCLKREYAGCLKKEMHFR